MKRNILIIEDDAEIIESIRFAFSIYWPDAELIAAGHGEKGIEYARAGNIDAIILDLGLPDMEGFEVLKEIRLFSSVPIIILTVNSTEGSTVNALDLEANDYVIKPFRQKELISRIQSHLDRWTRNEVLRSFDLINSETEEENQLENGPVNEEA